MLQQTSLEIFKQKYAFGNEQVPEDSFHRIAYALAKQESAEGTRHLEVKEAFLSVEGLSLHQVYWYYQFLEALNNGAIPAGRISSNIGAEDSKPNTSLINCFAGDTPVLTRLGIKSMKELADSGSEVEVLNGNGNWSKVTFKNLGKQAVTTLEFKHADTKNNFVKIQATDNHRWILSSGQVITTEFWTTGALFKKGYNQVDHIRPKTTVIDNEQFRLGILHGAVYGDGTALAKENTYTLTLFNEKLELCEAIGKELLGLGSSYDSYSQENLRFTINSTKNLKKLPAIEESLSYLRGFFAGLLATDGSISSTENSSTYVVLYGKKELVDWCKQYLPVIGITVTYTRKMASKGTRTNLGERKTDVYVVGIHTASIEDYLILRSLHRENWKPADFGSVRHNFWQFQGFTKGSTELVDVYCCEEPETHSFCLANGLLTSNCTVSRNIPDSIEGIAKTLNEAMLTLTKGCGIGYCCSSLRPKGAYVNGVGAETSGALSFMEIFDTMCKTIASAGGRRGAQMLTMHCWHPDILQFITCKREAGKFRQFNLSVLFTEEFMKAVKEDTNFDLFFPLHNKEFKNVEDLTLKNVLYDTFPFKSDDYIIHKTMGGTEFVVCKVYKTIRAKELWDIVMQSTYDFAEPGTLFIDRINQNNPLYPNEVIVATNPSLAKGTLVHTKEGIFPIEVLEGKTFQVKALDGSWGNATCWLSSESTKTISIDLGSSKVVRATPLHKFPVVNKLTGNIERKLVSSLEVGDEIPKNLVEPLGIEGDMTLTEEEGFFLGIWLADGSLTQRKTGGYSMYLSFNKQDRDLAERTLNYLNSIKVNPSTISDRGNELSIQLTATTPIEYLINRLGIHTGLKNIPSLVYSSNDSFIRGFVDGLISGDGHIDVKQSKITLVNKDKNFILDIAKLLSFMGITGVITESLTTSSFPNGKDYNKLYQRVAIAFGKASSQKFASIFQLTSSRKQRNLEVIADNVMKKGARQDNFLRVKNTWENEQEEPVWDISVEHPQHLFPIEWCYTGNCGEQPLPEFGSCLLGSVILSKFVRNPFKQAYEEPSFTNPDGYTGIGATFDWKTFDKTVRTFVRMLDNVVELHGLALPEQAHEIFHKRRHGMGYTGLGTTLQLLGMKYGSPEAVEFCEEVTKRLAVINLEESYKLGAEKGCAPIFEDAAIYTAWCKHPYTQKVASETNLLDAHENWRERPRFTHSTSIAPTGTISIAFGNNCSNGIEPSFAHSYFRNVIIPNKKTKKKVEVLSEEALIWKEHFGDAPYPEWFVTTQDILPEAHVAMQAAAQRWIDSSISKTVNVPSDISFKDFEDVYMNAYDSGLKGVTTYRPSGGFTAVLQTAEHLETLYEFTLEGGDTVVLTASDSVWYDGEEHDVENLYCALNEGYYGKL